MSRPASVGLALAILVALAGGAAHSQGSLSPPASEVQVVRDTLHGVVVEDPYRWLEDQQSPATRAWIDAQNRYTDRVLAGAPGFERIRARLEQLMSVESRGVPFERGGRYFYTRRAADQELSVLCMRKGLNGAEQVLVDPFPMSPDHATTVGFSSVTQDGKLMAYSIRAGGEDEVSLAFRDLDTGRDLPERMPRGRYFGVSIAPDHARLYYARQSPQGPRVFVHVFGEDPAADRVIFGEGRGPESIVSPTLSSDGRSLVVEVARGSTGSHDELYFQDLAEGGPFVTLVNDLDASFTPRLAGDRLYVLTNWNAPHGRILEIDPRHPAREGWREIVPEGKDAIQGFTVVGGRLCVDVLENVVSAIRIYDLTGKAEGRIQFPTLGSVSDLGGQWDKDEAFFTFVSFQVPTTIYRYEVSRKRRSEWWRARVPIASDRIAVEQVWYASKDGTRIPMFLVHRKGMKRDGSAPTLLTGYGGFDLSQRPSFTPRAAAWVEQGGVYALANLRGGGEFGEAWHQAGMQDRKQNVYDDFIAAAEWLIRDGWTRPGRLAIWGRSNGGLLVGAALTQRPDLFRAVVCGFPLLDMLRYHRFLVGRYWVPEYGSAEDPEQFKTLAAYSPYQHVKPGEHYPAVLLVSGDSDTRVAPLHARKMTALLQAASASGRPVLLRYDTKAGHVTGKPISEQVDDLARELQFLLWQLEVPSTGAGAGVEAGS